MYFLLLIFNFIFNSVPQNTTISKNFLYFCPRGSFYTGQKCQPCFTQQCSCTTPFGCDFVDCDLDQIKLKISVYNEYIDITKELEQCIDCPEGCAICETVHNQRTSFTCYSCKDGYYLIKDICVLKISSYKQDSLSLNYWQEQQHLPFIQVNKSACSIYFNSTYQCKICQDGFFLNEFQICEPCTFQCKKCSFRNTCDLCKDGYYWQPPEQCQICQDNLQNMKCLACKDNGKNCLKCNEGYYIIRKSNTESFCQNCLGNQGLPELWHFGCSQCTIGGFCQHCYEGYYLKNDTCKLCYGNAGKQSKQNFICSSCTQPLKCDKCKEEGYQLINNQTCANCSALIKNCNLCKLNNDTLQIQCEICQNGYYLDISNGKLSCSKCPQNFKRCILNEINANQFQLSPTQCDEGYYLVNRQDSVEKVCVLNDPENECFIMLDDSKQCKSCYPFDKWIKNGQNCTECKNCKKCEVQNSVVKCSSCQNGYNLIEGQCKQCISGCSVCNEKEQCLECFPNYRLVNTTLCEQCASKSCQQCNQNVTQCTKCMSSYFLDEKQNKCKKCPFGCEDCQLALGRRCSKCLTGHFTNGDGCRAPVPFCSMIDEKNGYCIVCKYGYRLQKGNCVPCLDRLGGYICGKNSGMTKNDYCQQYT